MPAASRADGNQTGGLLPWPVRQGKGDLHRKDEAENRLLRRSCPVQHASSHCGAALCAHLPGHGVGPLHSAREEEGEHPVEPVLHCPQPEKGGTLRAEFGAIGSNKLNLFDKKANSGKVMEQDGANRRQRNQQKR